ncbi:6-phosphofructokinase [Burkholderia multivorans]|uniref:6-phosphofructokinase n=1 Tax=Burkholderia multivorans TaxID=87883 RepID=UPI000A4623C8|nr:6-phosphofructokinase [Burkholderia multivorans]
MGSLMRAAVSMGCIVRRSARANKNERRLFDARRCCRKQASRQAGKQASRQAGKQASRQAGKQAPKHIATRRQQSRTRRTDTRVPRAFLAPSGDVGGGVQRGVVRSSSDPFSRGPA